MTTRTRRSPIKVEGFDNRIGPNKEGVGFGYVYFTDGTRVGWDNTHGPWFCNTSWGPTDDRHIHAALKFLVDNNIINPSKEDADDNADA